MQTEKKSFRNIMMAVAALLSYFAVYADNAAIPTSSGLMEQFPNITNFQLSCYLTYGTFTGLILILTTGIFTQFISKKKMAIGVYILYIVTNAVCLVSNNINVLVVARLVMGCCFGACNVLSVSIISTLWDDEERCTKLMGLNRSVSAVMGAAVSAVAGMLAIKNWHHAYLTNMFAIVVLILMIVYLPDQGPERKMAQEEKAKGSADAGFPVVRFATMFIMFSLLMVIIYSMAYYVGLFVTETGIGNAATTGMLGSVKEIVGFLCGFVFAALFMKMNKNMLAMLYFITAAAFAIFAVAHSMALTTVAMLVLGFANGFASPFAFAYAGSLVPPSKKTIAMGLMGAGMGIGGILSGNFRSLMMKIMHVETAQPTFMAIAGICIVLGIVVIIAPVSTKKKTA